MEIATVKTMITKAFDNDMVDGRTVKAFRSIKKRLKRGSNARDRELSLEEYQKLTEQAPAHLRALLVTAFHTGMRRGELLNLRWSNIDREKGFIRLQARETKEDKPRSIPLNRHVRAVLDTLPRAIHHDYVFTYRGEPIAYSLRRSLRTACKNVGITYGQKVVGGFRFHDVRATFDTNLERAGISETRRKALVGHSLSGMDKHYIRLKDDDLRQAMDQYTAWIDAQAASVTQTVPQEAARG